MNSRRSSCPFTLTEVLVASFVFVILLGAVVSSVAYTGRNYAIMRTRSELRIQSFLASERIKKDLHSSASNLILLAPEEGPIFQALSAPVLLRAGDDLTPPVDEYGNIIWTETVIYHVFDAPDGVRELRRTIFPRDNRMSTQEHYDQLESVMLTGDGSGARNGSAAATKTLLRNVTRFEIRIGRETIDAYAPAPERRWLYLGPRVLGPGDHTFTFTVTGRNALASGEDLGIDAVIGTLSASPQEGEHMLASAITTGTPAQAADMSGLAGWSNNRELALLGAKVNDSVAFRIYNDTWMNSTFVDNLATSWRTRVTEYRPTGEVVVELAGNANSWLATSQAPLGVNIDKTGHFNSSIRVLLAGHDPILGGNILLAGRRCRVQFSGPNSTGQYLGVTDAYIMERASGYNGVAGTVKRLTFGGNPGFTLTGGATIYSDFVDMEIDPDKDYLVSYHVKSDLGQGVMTTWTANPGQELSFMVANDAANVAGQADWSTLPAGAVTPKEEVCGVAALYVSFPAAGTFTSQPFDTRIASAAFSSITALASDITAWTPMRLRVRSGNKPDMSDATPWASAMLVPVTGAEESISSLAPGRYVQWQAELGTAYPYTLTPRLHAVSIKWPGLTRGVNLSASIGHGPTRGTFQVEVDGIPTPLTGLWMEFETQRRILNRDYTHRLLVQCEPRNR